MQPPLTDSKILSEFFETGYISDGDDVMDISDGLEEGLMECSGNLTSLRELEVFQKLSLFLTNSEAVQADCLKIERNVDKHFTENKKQTTIKNYFKL